MTDEIIRTNLEGFRRTSEEGNRIRQIVEIFGDPFSPQSEISYRVIDLDTLPPYVEINLGIEAALRRHEKLASSLET